MRFEIMSTEAGFYRRNVGCRCCGGEEHRWEIGFADGRGRGNSRGFLVGVDAVISLDGAEVSV